VDSGGRLWVGDASNNRVLRFDNAAGSPATYPLQCTGAVDMFLPLVSRLVN
jgi:hypothetical protein